MPHNIPCCVHYQLPGSQHPVEQSVRRIGKEWQPLEDLHVQKATSYQCLANLGSMHRQQLLRKRRGLWPASVPGVHPVASSAYTRCELLALKVADNIHLLSPTCHRASLPSCSFALQSGGHAKPLPVFRLCCCISLNHDIVWGSSRGARWHRAQMRKVDRAVPTSNRRGDRHTAPRRESVRSRASTGSVSSSFCMHRIAAAVGGTSASTGWLKSYKVKETIALCAGKSALAVSKCFRSSA